MAMAGVVVVVLFGRMVDSCSKIVKRAQFFSGKKSPYTHILGGGFKYFIFSPLLGEMIQFD